MRLLAHLLFGTGSFFLVLLGPSVPTANAQEEPIPPEIDDDDEGDDDEGDDDEGDDDEGDDDEGDDDEGDDDEGDDDEGDDDDDESDDEGNDDDDDESDDESDDDEGDDDEPTDEEEEPDAPEPGGDPSEDEGDVDDENSADEDPSEEQESGTEQRSGDDRDAATAASSQDASQKALTGDTDEQGTPSSSEESASLSRTEQAAATALMDRPVDKPSLTPITLSTSTWSRLEIREHYDELGVSRGRFQEGDRVFFRARLGVQTHPLPISDRSDVLIQFSPQASGQWGLDGTVGEANLGIYEGYFKVRTPRLDLRVGRMKMEYGDEVVIGALDWHQAGRAFDGLHAHYKMDKGYLDVFGTQVAEGGVQSGSQFLGGDEYFWGAYSGVGGYLGEKTDLDLYFLGLTAVRRQDVELADGSTATLQGGTLFTGGARFLIEAGVLDYRIEAGVQFGKTAPVLPATDPLEELEANPQLAYQAETELGFSFGKLTRLAFGGVIASGDNPATSKDEGWNELYPTGHKFLGLMDIIGPRTNIASAHLKVQRVVFGSLTAKLDAHVFARLEAGGLGNVAGPGMAGTELDVQLVQKLGKYALVRGLYGLFIPESGHYKSDSLAHYCELQAGVTF